MPWSHCGKTIADDVRCPACGFSKPAWTVKMDQTRLLQLSATWSGDAPAQADALRSAAADGKPFCEECEKARQAQRQAGGAA